MKICLVVPHFPPYVGGGEQLYYDIAKGLLRRGHQVRVVTAADGATGHRVYDGIDVWYCPWRIVFGHPLARLQDIRPHVQWSDLVHTAVYTTAPVARRAARRAGKPVIVLIHEIIGSRWGWFEPDPVKALAFRTYEYLVSRLSYDGYHVVSESTKRDYLRFISKREHIYRIYNSLHVPPMEQVAASSASLRACFGLPEGQRTFLYFGRPAPNKGVFVLQKAISILRQRGSIPEDVTFCFLLSGEPRDQRARFLENVRSMGLEDVVLVHPSVERSQLFKLVLDADYVVVPSVNEGFGFSAAEACSLGKPVISSDGGSLPEVVWGRRLLFENGNSQALADCLEQVVRRGEDCFDAVPEKRFDTETMLDAIEAMYEDVRKNRG